jgi:hypothetical protein
MHEFVEALGADASLLIDCERVTLLQNLDLGSDSNRLRVHECLDVDRRGVAGNLVAQPAEVRRL